VNIMQAVHRRCRIERHGQTVSDMMDGIVLLAVSLEVQIENLAAQVPAPAETGEPAPTKIAGEVDKNACLLLHTSAGSRRPGRHCDLHRQLIRHCHLLLCHCNLLTADKGHNDDAPRACRSKHVQLSRFDSVGSLRPSRFLPTILPCFHRLSSAGGSDAPLQMLANMIRSSEVFVRHGLTGHRPAQRLSI